MLERVIEDHLVKKVLALGGAVRKVQWIGRRGAPDRLVLLPERGPRRNRLPAEAIWVELKAPGKTPTALQVEEHATLERLGQRCVVIDSLEGVDRLLA